jgi:hypothetical protein
MVPLALSNFEFWALFLPLAQAGSQSVTDLWSSTGHLVDNSPMKHESPYRYLLKANLYHSASHLKVIFRP